MNTVTLVECPRDAMQGWKHPIATADKIRYLQALSEVGFHTIDAGSFVSPKSVPQMADTGAVFTELTGVDNLLAIVANARGAEEAAVFASVRYLGFPLSVSETFQQRNTNSDIATGWDRMRAIHDIARAHGKKLVTYISMAFGNPYGDPWSADVVHTFVNRLEEEGVDVIMLADTVGVATAQQVSDITSAALGAVKNATIGAHLHSSPQNWREKIDAAYSAGCRRFDAAINGIGGCPMSGSELVGNIDTLQLIGYLKTQNALPDLDRNALEKSTAIANEIFQS